MLGASATLSYFRSLYVVKLCVDLSLNNYKI
jgi:hypothetical protein